MTRDIHRVFNIINRDNNLYQVDFVRRYGGKLYYGDVTQPDLLRSAGIRAMICPNRPKPAMIIGLSCWGISSYSGGRSLLNNLYQVDFVRRYGGKLYYGDVTQPDLLRSAGIEKASIQHLNLLKDGHGGGHEHEPTALSLDNLI
jgi:hypothetical protein